jgi:TPR repeat protein
MSYLAFMYAIGRGGLARDDAQAISWYRRAAALGDEQAI